MAHKSLKENILARAKSDLIIDHVFFATLLLKMEIVIDDTVETAETDGNKIWFNPNFLDTLDQRETLFLLAHEVMHPAMEHIWRQEQREYNRWNQACDYVINQLLIDEGIGKMPKGGLYDRSIVAKGNGSAEGVYRILPEECSKKSVGMAGGAMDKMRKPTDPATAEKNRAEAKVRVLQAAAVAKAMGNLSQNMERFLDMITKPKKDWGKQLRRFFSERAKIDYSYARPARRNTSEEYLLPSPDGVKMGYIDIPVDCSGSVDKRQLSEFAVEINAIRNDTMPMKVIVRYFDSGICGKVQEFGPDEEIKLEPRGGGGTNFGPIFKSIQESGEQPIVCLVQTDLECNSYGNIIPDYPVLWCVYGGVPASYSNVPFGEILDVSE